MLKDMARRGLIRVGKIENGLGYGLLPFVVGIFGLVLGVIAVFGAFRVRREEKEAEQRQPARPVPSRAEPVPAVETMVAKPVETVVEAAPAVAPAVAGVAAAGATAFAVEEAKAEESAEETVVEEVEALPEVKKAAPGFDDLDENAKFGYELEYVEGIGPVFAQKFRDNGINTIRDFFERGVTAKGREELAEVTGISSKLILEWINHVDLYRIKGVGSEYADLLEEAGVDTVVELANRNATNLFNKMLAVNQEKKLVRRTPVEAQVQDWVQQAKTLPRRVTY
jgi:predicted flap endonuclease-1-like 5' DNA nuclease